MLNPDEHRLPVWRHKDTGDFALVRSDQKAPRLPGPRMRSQHLIVAKTGIGARVDRRS